MEVKKEANKNNKSNKSNIVFGTYRLKGSTLREALELAIDAGIRRFDTAQLYKNEAEVAAILDDLLGDRNNYTINTKIIETLDTDGTLELCRVSAERLGRINSIMLHRPMHTESWEGLCNAQREGYCNYIGLSNHNSSDIAKIYDICEVKPKCNQIEIHPHIANSSEVECREKLVATCMNLGMEVQAHSILTKNSRTHHSLYTPQDLMSYARAKFPSISYCITATSKDHLDELLTASKLINLDKFENAAPFHIYIGKEGNTAIPKTKKAKVKK